MNIIIGIGRGLESGKLNDSQWSAFQREVAKWTEAAGFELLAQVSGDSTSDQYGDEEAAWFAAVKEDGVQPYLAVAHLRASLEDLASKYGQDSIALTTGTTKLVSAAA